MNTHILHHFFHLASPSQSEAYHAEQDHLHEHFARTLMIHPDYIAYIDAHGYHFTPALADHVTKHHIENADGTTHNWTTAQVQAALEAAGMKNNPLNMTWGDAAYLANWYYSDEYPDYLKTETDVIKRTYKAAQDPDGYEGMTFMRFLSDVVGHELTIDWAAFL